MPTDPDDIGPQWWRDQEELQDGRLPLTRGEWNTDEDGRTLSGYFVCSTCGGRELP